MLRTRGEYDCSSEEEGFVTKRDRRVERTRERLQQAMSELVRERRYDTITIQEITDRANVGRTTFYLHYGSKDELFLSCHETIARGFHSLHSLSREELLSPYAPARMIAAYRRLLEAEAMLAPIFQGPDSRFILRQIRDRSAEQIEAMLRTGLAEADSVIPLDLLAAYLAGAQIALVAWWLEKRQPHSAESLAQSFHRLQRAAVRDALGLSDSK